MSNIDLETVKCLLHFEELYRDEISIETWPQDTSSAVPLRLGVIAKFGHKSLYPYQNSLVGTNNSGIWNLNSNGNYEIEFFIYPTANECGNRMFNLCGNNSDLNLGFYGDGTIYFSKHGNWDYSFTNGTTVLAINEWHHIILRISNQTAKVFIDGTEDISVGLPENKSLSITEVHIGEFLSEDEAYYIDEFMFKHSASTGTPTIPTSPYPFCVYKNHKKRNFGEVKSLLHFDYPYFNEPNDGLGDEIGIETWTEGTTGIVFEGSEIPNEATFAPKFGYRCVDMIGAYVQCDNESSIWNLSSKRKYEIGMFLQITSTENDKGIFSLMDTEKTNTIFNLSVLGGGILSFESSGFAVERISGTTVTSKDTWHYILMRISNKKINIYLDGNLEISTKLPSGIELTVGQVLIGDNTTMFTYIDEFMFRHSADKGNPIVPTQPYNGYLDKETIGGFGSGSDGDVIINMNTQINSYGIISSITDSRSFSVISWSNGSAIPDVGCEVMIHITAPCSTDSANYPFVGLYSFAKIAAIDGNYVVLDRDITTENGDDFTLISWLLDTYYIQVITVPNYNSLTVNSGCTVSPLSWSTATGGGIVAFRCKNDCTINGSIITLGKGAIRYDFYQMTHSKLVDRFLCSRGGGIFIACGGIFSAPSTARLGATWSGLGDGSNGAAGYGGKGGGAYGFNNKLVSGGAGGVGGGGGGAAAYMNYHAAGGDVGNSGKSATLVCGGGGGCGGKGGSVINGTTINTISGGGGGGGQGNSGGAGGTITFSNSAYNNSTYCLNGYAGTINGGNSRVRNNGAFPSGGGGGAPGGIGGYGSDGYSSSSGACIILICDKLKTDINAISTGGACGSTASYYVDGSSGAGGGGTGFCYIAAGELLDE